MASILSRPRCVNPLGPGRYGKYFKYMIFKLIIESSSLGIHCEIAATKPH